MSDTVAVRGPVAIILTQTQAIAIDALPDAPQVLGVANIDPAAAGEDAEAEALRYVEASVLSLEGHQPKEVSIGLPGTWVSHLVVSTPPLRKLDRISMFVREAAKATHAPSTDLLLADYTAKAESKVSQAHLVVAGRQSLVMALVEGLRSKGVRVRSATSSPSAAVLADIMEVHADGRGDDPAAVVLLRSDGFAIAVHQGHQLHQFRLVSVAIPEDDEAIAQVLTEELRRSSMAFREKSRGGTLKQVIVLGRITGNADHIAAAVSANTNIPTLVRESAGPHGDSMIEALSLTQIHRKGGPASLDMLPPECSGKTKNILTGVVTAASVAAGLAVAWMGADRLDSEVSQRQSSLIEAGELRGSLDGTIDQYGQLLRRTQEFASMKSELDRIGGTRINTVDLIHQVTLSLPDSVRLDKVVIQNPTWGETTFQIEGVVHASEWDFDFHLAQFVEQISEATGVAPIIDPAVDSDSEDASVHPFKIRMTWKMEDEGETEVDFAGSA